jgi:hypothetical protein
MGYGEKVFRVDVLFVKCYFVECCGVEPIVLYDRVVKPRDKVAWGGGVEGV